MSSQPQNDSPEHDMAAYFRVRKMLNDVREDSGDGFPIEIGTPLGAALTNLSRACVSSAVISIWQSYAQRNKIYIAGEDAGTLSSPNVDLILQKSKPSSFGRGEKTVMDPTYRNGREIAGADIKMGDHSILDQGLSKTLFADRKFKLELYKLAIYEVGGHFDWHRDSTHSDKHHGTVLVALDTQWTGGDLMMRRNGVETRVDMHPEIMQDDESERTLRAVAFYTDTEHKVEPVSEGVRIVLQYDVEVTGDNKDDKENSILESKLANVTSWDDLDEYGIQCLGSDIPTPEIQAMITNVSKIIKKLHASGVEEVAFPLQYLYRKASIRPEYLKGCDLMVYNALTASFNVALAPVLLGETFDEEDNDRLAYIFQSGDVSTGHEPLESAVFYLPELSSIEQVSSRDYIEHTGNESQKAEYMYFGGGMFVRPKTI